MTEVDPNRRRWSRGWIVLGGVAVIFAVAVLLFVWAVRSVARSVPTPADLAAVLEPEPFEDIGPTVVRSIVDLSNLTTVEMVEYTIVEKGTDGGFLDWANGDRLQLFAVARIGAGVDLSQVTIRSIAVSDDGVVDLTVPAPTIQYVAVDNQATQILDRDTGLFTKGDPRLETDARRVAEDVLKQAALDEGILLRAEENARQVITNFLVNLGYRGAVIEFE